jgi:hypothetical protein
MSEESRFEGALAAMSAAAGRVQVAGDDAAAFAALGETLFWLTSLDDELRKHHRRQYKAGLALFTPAVGLMQGLHHARDRILDGLAVKQVVAPMAEIAQLGSYRWSPIPAPGSAKYRADWLAYQGALVNRDLFDALGPCIYFLQMAVSVVVSEGPGARAIYTATVQRGLAHLDEYNQDPLGWSHDVDPSSVSFPDHNILDILDAKDHLTGTYESWKEDFGIDWLRGHGFEVLDGDARHYPLLTSLWRKAMKDRAVDLTGVLYSTPDVLLPLGICNFCIWRVGAAPNSCKAFPLGIPDAIRVGMVDHRYVYKGDQDYQFEQNPDKMPLLENDIISMLPGVYDKNAPPQDPKLWLFLNSL